MRLSLPIAIRIWEISIWFDPHRERKSSAVSRRFSKSSPINKSDWLLIGTSARKFSKISFIYSWFIGNGFVYFWNFLFLKSTWIRCSTSKFLCLHRLAACSAINKRLQASSLKQSGSVVRLPFILDEFWFKVVIGRLNLGWDVWSDMCILLSPIRLIRSWKAS